MQADSNPTRSKLFRLITIAASGLGSFVIGMWGLRVGFGESLASLSGTMIGGVVAALCALAASLAAMSFFAGVDESEDFVYRETQLDKLTGFFARTATLSMLS